VESQTAILSEKPSRFELHPVAFGHGVLQSSICDYSLRGGYKSGLCTPLNLIDQNGFW
jgi:hypothetical protein